MIYEPTVLILGAGASIPYGFPSGRDLKSAVCARPWHHVYEELGLSNDSIREFQTSLQLSARPSVDAFLENRTEFTHIGKILMADCLIASEDAKKLFPRVLHWYEYLLTEMNCPFEKFGDENALCVITFNYDRSLEHFLFTALANSYGKTSEQVASVLRQIPIIHVHGQLGLLEWQAETPEKSVRAYSTDRRIERLKVAAEGIKIISESTDDSPEFTDARERLAQAKRIYFLGFGYHGTNMRRLGFAWDQRSHWATRLREGELRVIGGTFFGFTETEREVCREGFGLSEAGSTHYEILDYLRHSESFLTVEVSAP